MNATVEPLHGGFGRRLPHNLDAERAVLGTLLLNDGVGLDKLGLRPGDFVIEAHSAIFIEMVRRRAAGEISNPITMRSWAEAPPQEVVLAPAGAAPGGAALLVWLADRGAADAAPYAAAVHEDARRRELIEIGEAIVDAAYNGRPVAEVLAEATTGLADGLQATGPGTPLPYTLFAESKPILNGQWLIKGVLPRTGVAVVYGPSGSGKTFVTLDALLHAALGWEWRGRKTTKACVLYLCPDGGAAIVNRLAAFRHHHRVRAADLIVVTCPIDLLGKVGAGDLDRLEALVKHIESAHGIDANVIAIDTVSRSMPGGDENQPADMSRYVSNLGRLCADGKRLVVGIHHTPKADNTIPRGHSSLHGAADCELNITKGNIRIAKQRDGEDGIEITFRLQTVEIGIDEDGDPVTSCVALPLEPAGNGTVERIEQNANERWLIDTVVRIAEGDGPLYSTSPNHVSYAPKVLAAQPGRPHRYAYATIKTDFERLVNAGTIEIGQGWDAKNRKSTPRILRIGDHFVKASAKP